MTPMWLFNDNECFNHRHRLSILGYNLECVRVGACACSGLTPGSFLYPPTEESLGPDEATHDAHSIHMYNGFLPGVHTLLEWLSDDLRSVLTKALVQLRIYRSAVYSNMIQNWISHRCFPKASCPLIKRLANAAHIHSRNKFYQRRYANFIPFRPRRC